MDETSWLDRLLRLPPRRLEMSGLRAATGIAALGAAALTLVMLSYQCYFQTFVLDPSELQTYMLTFTAARFLWIGVPIILAMFASALTIDDLFRARRLSVGRGVVVALTVWWLSVFSTGAYWIGEFRKAARQPASDVPHA